MAAFTRGDQVAWTMQDGNVMTGIIKTVWRNVLDVERVDGGQVELPYNMARKATSDDVQAAIRFFTSNFGKIGK